MKEKLTLHIDKNTLKRSRLQAKQKGTTLSQMVEEYLQQISETAAEPDESRKSILDEIMGCIVLDENKSYRTHIEEARANNGMLVQ